MGNSCWLTYNSTTSSFCYLNFFFTLHSLILNRQFKLKSNKNSHFERFYRVIILFSHVFTHVTRQKILFTKFSTKPRKFPPLRKERIESKFMFVHFKIQCWITKPIEVLKVEEVENSVLKKWASKFVSLKFRISRIFCKIWNFLSP